MKNIRKKYLPFKWEPSEYSEPEITEDSQEDGSSSAAPPNSEDRYTVARDFQNELTEWIHTNHP